MRKKKRVVTKLSVLSVTGARVVTGAVVTGAVVTGAVVTGDAVTGAFVAAGVRRESIVFVFVFVFGFGFGFVLQNPAAGSSTMKRQKNKTKGFHQR